MAEQLRDLPQDSWHLAFIYANEEAYDTYLAFLSSYPDCEVILWAEDDHLACSALRSHPCGFFVLPADDEQFLRIMKRCQSWVNALRTISYSDTIGNRNIRCIEVQYVESSGHSCIIHCRDNTYTLNCGLTSLQNQLGGGFLCCRRGVLVNMRYIAEIQDKTILMQDGTVLPLSPSKEDVIRAEIYEYLQEHSCFLQGGNFL